MKKCDRQPSLRQIEGFKCRFIHAEMPGWRIVRDQANLDYLTATTRAEQPCEPGFRRPNEIQSVTL